MTVLSTNTTARPAGAGIFGSIAARLRTWRNVQATRKALSHLSDRELDDIGLSRHDAVYFGGAR